ncbi:TPA: hypothetical protein DDZ01_01925 [Candidatus Uhrbacteria bacterium]|nr:hypothetical protein [Candidatus Uhrbacteria bacterium]HCB55854.1 hypothetical protein [Candidatus Uhrbacteria bacterium]
MHALVASEHQLLGLLLVTDHLDELGDLSAEHGLQVRPDLVLLVLGVVRAGLVPLGGRGLGLDPGRIGMAGGEDRKGGNVGGHDFTFLWKMAGWVPLSFCWGGGKEHWGHGQRNLPGRPEKKWDSDLQARCRLEVIGRMREARKSLVPSFDNRSFFLIAVARKKRCVVSSVLSSGLWVLSRHTFRTMVQTV